jgi:hypothetical protein
MENEKKIILGEEYDEVLIERLKSFLVNDGAIFKDKKEALAGSQDYVSYELEYQGDIIRIEIETYIGVSITGKESIVDHVFKELKK